MRGISLDNDKLYKVSLSIINLSGSQAVLLSAEGLVTTPVLLLMELATVSDFFASGAHLQRQKIQGVKIITNLADHWAGPGDHQHLVGIQMEAIEAAGLEAQHVTGYGVLFGMTVLAMD